MRPSAMKIGALRCQKIAPPCCRMEAILRIHRGCKLPAAADEFLEQAFVYVQNQIAVHNWNGDRLFITLKHHQLLHCAERSTFVSPRVTWCFMGEHFMKRNKKTLCTSWQCDCNCSFMNGGCVCALDGPAMHIQLNPSTATALQ